MVDFQTWNMNQTHPTSYMGVVDQCQNWFCLFTLWVDQGFILDTTQQLLQNPYKYEGNFHLLPTPSLMLTTKSYIVSVMLTHFPSPGYHKLKLDNMAPALQHIIA